MSGALPDLVDPWRAVRARAVFSGTLAASRLQRLVEAVEGLGGTVVPDISYDMRFERRPDGLCVVLGRVSARVILTCQRCLSDVDIGVDAPIAVALVRTDEAARDLPPDLDPLVVTDDVLCPLDLVEDEVLLGIPPVPRHELGACPEGSHAGAGVQLFGSATEEHVAEASMSEQSNPFAVLAALKRD